MCPDLSVFQLHLLIAEFALLSAHLNHHPHLPHPHILEVVAEAEGELVEGAEAVEKNNPKNFVKVAVVDLEAEVAEEAEAVAEAEAEEAVAEVVVEVVVEVVAEGADPLLYKVQKD